MNQLKHMHLEDFVIPNIENYIKDIPTLHFEDNFLIREFKTGEKYLVINKNKINESKKFMLANNITGIEINMSLGYDLLSIAFLKDFTFIDKLNLVHQPLKSTEELNQLHNLTEFSLDSYFYTPIDFNNFPRLISCSIHWTPNAINLFKQNQLKCLYMRNYKGADCEEITKLINLEDLSIINSNIKSIVALKYLKKIKRLELALLKGLTSLEGVEYLKELSELSIESCKKINKLDEVSGLINLKILSISNDGKIASLKPIEKLVDLEKFFFIEDTNIIDGDLSPIISLKNLEKISFMNRKHYSHKRDVKTGKIYENN